MADATSSLRGHRPRPSRPHATRRYAAPAAWIWSHRPVAIAPASTASPSASRSAPCPTITTLGASSTAPCSLFSHPAQGGPVGAHMRVVIGQVRGITDQAHSRPATPGLADAGVQHRRFVARVGADQHDIFCAVDLLDRRCAHIGQNGCPQAASPHRYGIRRYRPAPRSAVSAHKRPRPAPDRPPDPPTFLPFIAAAAAPSASGQLAGRSLPFSRI